MATFAKQIATYTHTYIYLFGVTDRIITIELPIQAGYQAISLKPSTPFNSLHDKAIMSMAVVNPYLPP